MSKAPNYDGKYPEAGERIGPAWQQIWDHLADGRWYAGPDLARVFSQNVSSVTISKMLYKAAKSGFLETKGVRPARMPNLHKEYRRFDSEVKNAKSSV